MTHEEDRIARLEDEVRTLKQQLEQSRSVRADLFATLRSIGEAVIQTDVSGRIEWLNSAAVKLAGIINIKARGKMLGEVFRFSDDPAFATLFDLPTMKDARAGKVLQLDDLFMAPVAERTVYHVSCSISSIYTGKDESILTGRVLVLKDLTEVYDALYIARENERKLAAERTRLKTLGDNMPNGCLYRFTYSTLTEQAGFTYLSAAWERISGITVDEAMSNLNALTERMHPDDRPLYADAFAKSLATMERFNAEMRFMLPSGDMRWGRLSSMPHLEGTDVVWDGFLMDITETKTSELRLIAEKERFEAIGNNIPGTLYRFRADLDGSRMGFEYLSGTWNRFMGVPAEATLADINAVFRYVHPADMPMLAESIRENIATLAPFFVEIRYLHPLDGNTYWFRLSSQPRRDGNTMLADGIILDITTQKTAELKLIAEKERFEAIGDHMLNGTLFRYRMDMRTGQMAMDYVSGTCEKVTGVPADAVVADINSLMASMDADDRAMLLKRLRERAEAGDLSYFFFEFRFLHPVSRKTRRMQLSAKPSRKGQVLYSDGMFIDVTERYEAEQALIAEKERLETIGNNIPGGALYRFKVNVATGSIVLDYVSDTWGTVIGVSPKIIVGVPSGERLPNGMNLFDGIDPADMPMLMEHINDCITHLNNFHTELRFHRPDGKLLWLMMSARPTRHGAFIYVDGIIFDITARKEAEQALVFEKERLQNLGDNLPNGVLFRYEIEHSALSKPDWVPHLKLGYASALWEQISNVPRADAGRDLRPVFAKIHPDDLAAIYPVMYEAMHSLTTFNAEVRYAYTPGEMHWIQISAHPRLEGDLLVIDGFMIDITARKEVEQALIGEKERLETIGNNMPDGALYRSRMDMTSGNIWLEYVSASWAKISGVSVETALKDIGSVFARMEPGYLEEMVRLSIQSTVDLKPFHLEFGYYHPIDGKTHRMKIASVPVADGDGYYADGTLFDITERYEAEQALIGEKERLETIGDNLPDGALFRFRIDLRNNQMSLDYVSRTCEKVTGVSVEQALTGIGSFFASVDPADRPALMECIRESVSGLKRFNIELRYHHPVSRKKLWFLLTAQPRREGDVVYSDGLIIDVTERREATEELERYRRDLELMVAERTAELKASNEELESTGEELYATNEELYATNSELNNKNYQLSSEVAARMEVMRRLEDSESKVRNFIRRSFEGILMMDCEGRIVEWNEAMTRITGVAHSEALGKYNWDLLREFLPKGEGVNRDALYERIRREEMAYISGGSGRRSLLTEDVLHMPDGTKRYLQVSVFPIALTDTCYFGKILRDITEQKQTYMELERYRTQLEEMVEEKSRDLLATHASLEATNRRQALFIKVLQILQMEPDVPAAMNMALAELGAYTGVDRLATWENHPDGLTYGCTYEWCNTGVEPAIQYLGSMTIEAGKPWFDMLAKDDYICTSDMATLHPFIQGMLEQQGVRSIAVFPMSILGMQFGFLSFNFLHAKEWDMRDVELMAQMAQIMSTATRRWQVETALNASRETMQKVLDNINANIFVTDYESMKIIFANKRFREEAPCETEDTECWKMLNAGKDELCSHCPKPLLLDENHNPTGVTMWEDLNPVTGRWYAIQSTAIKWTDGRRAIMELALDITDRKAVEVELIRAKEKAEESDRLKSAFLANVSHEIRTPLNGIIGFLQFLSSDSLQPERRREYTRIVNNNGTQLVKLIDDIVDISKIEARQMKMYPTPVPINTLMADLYTFFDTYMHSAGKEHHVALVLDESGSVPGCVALIDPTRLRQVLNNLIGNAVKFTEKGYICFGYRQSAPDLLEFTVEDTGIGIPPSMHEIIFERFRQAETETDDRSIGRIYGGTGLGLAISRSLVQLMGGNMTVESTEGAGATFRFTVKYVAS